MIELFTLWKNTRLVVLVAVIAGVYAACLIPFKVVLPFIPGITEFRLAAVIPVISSLLFGHAAAWGSAFGNLIGDLLGGTFGLGSIFGFPGNLMYGLLPYILWREIVKSAPIINNFKNLLQYILVTFIASLSCGLIIGWGLDLLGFVPYSALANIIFLNNFIVSLILGPILLNLLYNRVKRWGLLYEEIVEKKYKKRWVIIPTILLIIIIILGFTIGNLISIGIYHSPLLQAGFTAGIKGMPLLAYTLLPFIILSFILLFFL